MRLKVQFFLSWFKIGFLSGDYWILELDENYSYAGNQIEIMIIKIDNKTVVNEKNINVISGITSGEIRKGVSQFTINLSPLEWNSKQWNIFYSLIISSLISMFISYRGLKYYRKKNGIRKIEG